MGKTKKELSIEGLENLLTKLMNGRSSNKKKAEGLQIYYNYLVCKERYTVQDVTDLIKKKLYKSVIDNIIKDIKQFKKYICYNNEEDYDSTDILSVYNNNVNDILELMNKLIPVEIIYIRDLYNDVLGEELIVYYFHDFLESFLTKEVTYQSLFESIEMINMEIEYADSGLL